MTNVYSALSWPSLARLGGIHHTVYRSIGSRRFSTARRRQDIQAKKIPGVSASISIEVDSERFPEGLPPATAKRFSDTSITRVVARPVDDFVERKVIDSLCTKNLDGDLVQHSDSRRNLFVLDGPRGAGKSTVMMRTVQSARNRGVITLYIPSARQWTMGEGFFAATVQEGKDQASEGLDAVRFFDRPKQTLATLRAFHAAHGPRLSTIPVDKTILRLDGSDPQFERGELSDVSDVAGLVSLGVRTLEAVDSDWRVMPRRGGDVLAYTVNALCMQRDIPFLIAIDEYDAFLGLTALVSERSRHLHANAIRAVGQHFGRGSLARTAKSMRRGSILLASSKAHGRTSCRPSRVVGTTDFPVSEDIRNDPRGTRWQEKLRWHCEESPATTCGMDGVEVPAEWTMDPTSVAAARTAPCVEFIDIPGMSLQESTTLLSMYAKQGHRSSVLEHERKRIFALSGGRAEEYSRLCRST